VSRVFLRCPPPPDRAAAHPTRDPLSGAASTRRPGSTVSHKESEKDLPNSWFRVGLPAENATARFQNHKNTLGSTRIHPGSARIPRIPHFA
jgi:hypothetical protein